MEKNITIEYKENYLEITLKGTLDFSEYINVMQRVATRDDLPKQLRVLGIDKGLIINFSPSDSLKLSEMRKQVIAKFEEVRHAYVVDDPVNTAFAMLATNETNQSNYIGKIFSEESTALQWLLRD